MKQIVAVLAGALLLFGMGLPACAQTSAKESDEERKARILENLMYEFPQLADVEVEMGPLEATDLSGLEHGRFTVNGQQTQEFLVTAEGTLYLIGGEPIDVSRTADDLAAAQSEREAEKAREAQELHARLDKAIEGLPVRGPAEAPITIVEFSDFQCPYCARAAETVETLLEKYPDDVRLVYVQFPLDQIHPWARSASVAAVCAARQDDDAFWTLHDRYFLNQRSLEPGDVLTESKRYIAESGIDLAAWEACTTDQSSAAYQESMQAVEAGLALGQELGIRSTPSFFINGRPVIGAESLETFERVIGEARQSLDDAR